MCYIVHFKHIIKRNVYSFTVKFYVILLPQIKKNIHVIDLVSNATFSNISAILWRPVLVVEEAGTPGENHRVHVIDKTKSLPCYPLKYDLYPPIVLRFLNTYPFPGIVIFHLFFPH